jgi:hypothetical protein
VPDAEHSRVVGWILNDIFLLSNPDKEAGALTAHDLLFDMVRSQHALKATNAVIAEGVTVVATDFKFKREEINERLAASYSGASCGWRSEYSEIVATHFLVSCLQTIPELASFGSFVRREFLGVIQVLRDD